MQLTQYLPRITKELYHTPWLILPSAHASLVKGFERYLADGPMQIADATEEESIISNPLPNVARINVVGVIGKRLGMIEQCMGGCDLNKVSAAIDVAMSDSNVDTILFDFNTPGGTVTGVPELAEKIAEVSKVKKTYAYCDMLCASAGYYLASQCNTIISAPSADLGSVGVYSIFTDFTRAYDKEGITINAISAGTHKLDGASFKVMSDEVRAIFQADVNRIYNDFKAAVTSKRSIKDEDLQGQCFSGPDLVEKGFVDGFISDFQGMADSLKAETA